MNIIGIESSCDETSVAVFADGELKSNLISSQDFHIKYGGVVPELSSRAHLRIIVPLVNQALEEAGLKKEDISHVAATAGPGLIGALLVGFTFARGFAYSLGVPFIPVNHIEAHLFSGFLMEEKPEFPMLTLVVSGGHTILFLAESFTKIRLIGTTVDDAAGEAFDKVAKMLGLGYPGGPKIQKAASMGDPDKINFPVANLKNKYNFSFSGIKTAVLRHLQENHNFEKEEIPDNAANDVAASFQKSVIDALIINTKRTLKNYDIRSVSLAGGVAANKALRDRFIETAKEFGKKIVIPDMKYCGDNGAMIAMRAKQLVVAGETFPISYQPFPSFRSKYLIDSVD